LVLVSEVRDRHAVDQRGLRMAEFRGRHTHLSCFFQGSELRDSVRFGERSPRPDAVGVSVILMPPAPLAANAKPLERPKS